jgi:hypothetical protein
MLAAAATMFTLLVGILVNHARLSGLKSDVNSIRTEMSGLRGEMSTLRTDMNVRFEEMKDW